MSALEFQISPDLSNLIRSVSRTAGLPESELLLAGFAALVFRHSRRSPVVIRIPADRDNWNVMHLNVAAGKSFEKLLADTSVLNLDAVSLVGFAYSQQPQQESKFNINLSINTNGEQICGAVSYNEAELDAASVQRLLGQFETLVEGAVNNPHLSIGDLPFLSVAESKQILVDWNETRAEFRDDLCVQQLFEAQVVQTPDAVAAVFNDSQLTYDELNKRANRLAHYLRAQGIGPERVIGICVEPSLELPVAVLGVLKSGAAYLPLDPVYPPERLHYMAEDARVRLILTQQRLREKIAAIGVGTGLELDAEQDLWADQPVENPTLLTTARNACYVIYTSGSTGQPKGTIIEHRSLVNLAAALKKVCGVGPEDRVLQFASFSFDQSVREIFEPLLSGAALYLVPRDKLMPGQPLFDVLRHNRITAVTLAPSVMAHLPVAPLPDLTKLSAGGEALPGGVVDRWAPGRKLFNAYGPSEVTFASSLPQCFANNGKPTIGKPLQNVRYFVVDERMQLCAIGMPGELLIGGAGLARGFYQLPELTAERFIPDPFSGEAGARLYRSGDLVRWLPTGEIDYLGRLDQQVKLRGLRIELGEIEAVLLKHESVTATAVILNTEIPGKEQLVAYVVPAKAELPVDELKKFLATRLPPHMVPPIFVPLERIPVTPAGKVDKSALPSLDSVRQQRPYVAPSTPAEQKVAEIWKRVLDLDRVSATDNFFELGGSSLKGTTLLALVEDGFRVKLSFAKVFEHPSLREFTQLIDGSTQNVLSTTAEGAVLLRRAERDDRHIFFIHDASGGVDSLVPLSNQIEASWNVWGIQAEPLDPETAPEVSLESLAADYNRKMRAVQPEGPWFIGGWSFGAVVAYEMSRQLLAGGHEVSLLTAIDAEPPNSHKWNSVLTQFVDNLKAAFKPAAAAVSSVTDTSKACQLLLNRISRYQNAGDRIRPCTPDAVSEAIGGWQERNDEEIFDALRRVTSYIGALSVYETGAPIAVNMENFQAAVSAGSHQGQWEAFMSGRVRHHVLNGDHRSILRPPIVDDLASALNEVLTDQLPKAFSRAAD
ncbi:MAG TPA: amino acid adenylation domain-containing protein [Pyrinomonadaceae bacterium]|nr:amino acid adenylation domain-containing protein [Pyrinomonadaceae bacterium]